MSDSPIMNTYARYPVTLHHGEGARVWDTEGREYLDCVGGIASLPLGHGSKLIADALHEQALRIHHVSNLYWSEPQMKLAQWLVDHSEFDRVFFCNSGAEANEGAIKLTRKYGHQVLKAEVPVIIAAENSFHGRTLATVTATGQKKYQQGFAPLVPGFEHVPYNDFQSLQDTFQKVSKIPGSRVAAVLLEPLQAEGGVVPGELEYFKKVRELCTAEQALLIFDEVQTGVGRTGNFWGYETLGVIPDVITSAKGLGGGVPIGALLAKEFCSVFAPGEHASTFGGNPLATFVASRVCETVGTEAFLAQVRSVGGTLRDALGELSVRFPSVVKEVRGWGLLLGLVLHDDSRFVAADVVGAALNSGLLLVPAGPKVVRFVPPLVITEKEVLHAVRIVESALEGLTR